MPKANGAIGGKKGRPPRAGPRPDAETEDRAPALNGRRRGPHGENGSSSSADEEDTNSDLGDRQDPTERRLIRHEYSMLRERTQANRHEYVNPGSDELHRTLEETERLFKKVKEPREAALDSQVVALISQIAKQQAQQLHTDFVVFEPVEFTEKLITLVSGYQLREGEAERARISAEGWAKLGEAAQPFFKRSPPLHLMAGTFERGPPVPRTREKRVKDVADKNKGPSTAPKQLASLEETEKHEVTTAEVQRMLTCLQDFYEKWDHKPICFFEFVINPHSYGQTVENMFYASFLVKDGAARVFLDEDKLPVIEPVVDQRGEDEIARLPKHQVVISLSPQEWKDLIETFNIQDPLIPPRIPLPRRHGNGPEEGPSGPR